MENKVILERQALVEEITFEALKRQLDREVGALTLAYDILAPYKMSEKSIVISPYAIVTLTENLEHLIDFLSVMKFYMNDLYIQCKDKTI